MDYSILENDVELIEKYKKGDKSSLEKIYYKYKKQLLKIIWYYVHDIHDVEDVMQTLFLKLITGINKYKPYKDVKFKTWLFRVAVNTAKDFLRKKKPEINIEQIDSLEDSREELTEKIADHELIKKIRKSVILLPLKYREVISLLYFENLTYDEVAKILRKPVGTIKSRINYALNLLRKKFNVDLNK